MEWKRYLKLCQRASCKDGYALAWWTAKWESGDLVRWKGDLYVPFDYRFGFHKGKATGVAIIRSVKTHCVYDAPLREVEETA